MKRPLLLVIAALLLALLVWVFWPSEAETSTDSYAENGTNAAQAAAVPKLKLASAVEERSTLADALNSPTTDISADLRLVSVLLDTFRSNFPHDGNPVGSNAEITAALTGKNRLRLSLIPPDHPAVNRIGELCDRWGTPFFFHAQSGTKMEIRSAGPDRKLHTDDDAVIAP